jgi:intracellular multiplication protein IcmJ
MPSVTSRQGKAAALMGVSTDSTSVSAAGPGFDPLAATHVRWSAGSSDVPLTIQLSHSITKDPSGWDLCTGPASVGRIQVAVLHRDASRCCFCGFRSQKYQELLVQGGRYWDLDSVVTACIFCAQVVTFERVHRMRSAVLISAPGITQPDLNALLKAVYVARISQGAMADRARLVLDKLIEPGRRGARARFGSDDPKVLYEAMARTSSPVERLDLLETCRDLRLFPLDRRILSEAGLEFNQFPQILAYWRSKSGPFGGSSPPHWDPAAFDSIIENGPNSPLRWRN